MYSARRSHQQLTNNQYFNCIQIQMTQILSSTKKKFQPTSIFPRYFSRIPWRWRKRVSCFKDFPFPLQSSFSPVRKNFQLEFKRFLLVSFQFYCPKIYLLICFLFQLFPAQRCDPGPEIYMNFQQLTAWELECFVLVKVAMVFGF